MEYEGRQIKKCYKKRTLKNPKNLLPVSIEISIDRQGLSYLKTTQEVIYFLDAVSNPSRNSISSIHVKERKVDGETSLKILSSEMDPAEIRLIR